MKADEFKVPMFQDLTPGKKPVAKAPAVMPGEEGKAQPFAIKDFQSKATFGKAVKDNLAKVKFEAGKFMEEGTLLTNVEEYSRRVREDADRYARQTREEAELLKSEIEHQLAQAKILAAKGQDEATNLVKEANAQVAEIKRVASEKGYVEGFANGKAAQAVENSKLVGLVNDLLHYLSNLKRTMLRENEAQIARLSLLTARKVIHRELIQHQDLVLQMLQESIKQFEGMDKVKIRINPIEYDFLIEHKEEITAYGEEGQTINLRADKLINPGCAVIESDFAEVNLSLSQQMAILDERIESCIEDRKKLFRPQPKASSEEPLSQSARSGVAAPPA